MLHKSYDKYYLYIYIRNNYILNYYRIHTSYIKLVVLLSICKSQLYTKKKYQCLLEKMQLYDEFVYHKYICINNICHNFYGAFFSLHKYHSPQTDISPTRTRYPQLLDRYYW
jgi:hypothetical protein